MNTKINTSHSILAGSSAMRWMLAGAMLSATMLGAACGEAINEPVNSQTTTRAISQSDLADTEPYTLKTDIVGGLVLVCNTGAELEPHTLSPTGTDALAAWLETCLAELSQEHGGPMSDSLIDRCVDKTVSDYDSHLSASLPGKPLSGGSHQTKADIKDIRSTAGRFWLCSVDLEGFDNPLPMPNDRAQEFKEACKEASGVAPKSVATGLLFDLVHAEGLHSPCPDIDFDNPKQDSGGLVFECASNQHVISQVAARGIGGLEVVMDRCPGQELSEAWVGGQSEADATTIYACTAHGATVAHYDGFGAFLEFEHDCTERGGQAYRRDPGTEGAAADYLCTANGDLRSDIETVNDYSRMRAGCALQGGAILTTNPQAMYRPGTVGRDGREPEAAFARVPHKGVDQHGQLYVICMPGADITECNNDREFANAWHDCINSGKIPVVWDPNPSPQHSEQPADH